MPPVFNRSIQAEITMRNDTLNRQTGVTLVEIMIAITVGLILSAGLVQVFTSSKQAYKMQDSLGLLQENGRFALNTLTRAAHMADHWGGIDPEDVQAGSVAGNITGVGDCDGAWVADTNTGVRGYEGAATIGAVADFPTSCIADSDYVPHSDILVVRYADAETVPAANNATTVFVRSAVGNVGTLMLGTGTIPTSLPNQDGTYNFVYKTDIFYLRTCSAKTNGSCNDSVPTLVRLTLRGDTANAPEMVEEELAENIEQLQFIYGRDMRSNKDTNSDGTVDASDVNTGSDGDVDRYDNASVTATNGLSTTDWWSKVVSVRVSLLARSKDQDSNVTDSNTYDLLGYSYSVPSADQKYRRKQYTRLIQIRNRNRS